RSGIDPALEAGRRAAEDDDWALRARAHDRHFARVVARRFSLLVAGLVLLVDDDRAEIPQRREDRRTRADGDLLPSVAQRQPFVIPLAVAQCTVQHRDAI